MFNIKLNDSLISLKYINADLAIFLLELVKPSWFDSRSFVMAESFSGVRSSIAGLSLKVVPQSSYLASW